ncbi:MAG: YafY family transcriptional regulator [Clostridiales bacterium]|nr:YafY family transcriptional regulator [Clostridiales bacterium]
MQIARLFEIVYLLTQQESIPASRLAERFEVSTRTIYRDIDLLSGAGVPVYAVKGKGGGLRLMPGFTLEKALVSKQEQNDILSGLQAMAAVRLPEAGATLEKLSGLFEQPAPDWIAIDFSDWGPRSSDKLQVLQQAILTQRVIEFDYYNSNCEHALRSVEPARLWFKHRAWYLLGYCLTREAPRLFKLTRMRNVQLLDRPCTHAVEEAEPQMPEAPPEGRSLRLVLQLSPKAAYRVYDEFEEATVTRREDGSFLVEMEAVVDEWLMGYLLSFGTLALVLEPPELRERIRLRLMEIFRTYM